MIPSEAGVEMGNPRRIRVRGMRALTEAWEQEVRRLVALRDTVVADARIREPLDAMVGRPTLAALAQVLKRTKGWEEGADGVFRYALAGGHIAFDPATTELEIVAWASEEVTAQGEAAVTMGTEGADVIEAEGAGVYYDDGWSGKTEEDAQRAAEEAADRALSEAIERARQRERQEADETGVEPASQEAERRAEASTAFAAAARRDELRRQAEDSLMAIGVEGRVVFQQALGEAYRDAILAYARARHADDIRVSVAGDVLRIQFQTTDLSQWQEEEIRTTFRYNQETGEVDLFDVEDLGTDLQPPYHDWLLDSAAAEVASVIESNALIHEYIPAAHPSYQPSAAIEAPPAASAERITKENESPVGGRSDRASSSARRYIMARCPESVPVGRVFSLLVSIIQSHPATVGGLKPFAVPREGRDVLLVVHAAGLRVLGDPRQVVRVPANGDSEPVMFELCAEAPGPRPVSVTAWLGGSYLGELVMEVTAEIGHPTGPHRNALAEITTESVDGAVSLVVRYEPRQVAYRFEFRDEDNPSEVTSLLAYEPGPLVEHLVADLDDLAKRRTGYSAAQTRDYLVNAGAKLWSQLIPEQLRQQFWDRQDRIRQLTILDDTDAVPWELLYPMDPGHDAGFLVEQFPVTRAIFGWRPSRTLNLRPARLVLPEGSLPEAMDEIDAIRRLLDPEQPSSDVISALTPLQDLIAKGNFGLLHFACHNTYDPARGSSIMLDDVQFTLTQMATAVINKVLARHAPTIFMNACRSAGLSPSYNQLDGWAREFLKAGAGAFIGTLWAVSDVAAGEFAWEFYSQLQAGSSFGTAVTRARQAAAGQPDDPTWLAYTAYGDPRATVSHGNHGVSDTT